MKADLLLIEELLARYCFAHDSENVNMLAPCFAKTAEMRGVRGPEAIAAAYGAGYKGLTARRRHVLTNFVVLEDGESDALVQAYETFYLIRGEQLELHLTGIYRARVVLEDNEWKIYSIEGSFDVPYDPGDMPRVPASQFPLDDTG